MPSTSTSGPHQRIRTSWASCRASGSRSSGSVAPEYTRPGRVRRRGPAPARAPGRVRRACPYLTAPDHPSAGRRDGLRRPAPAAPREAAVPGAVRTIRRAAAARGRIGDFGWWTVTGWPCWSARRGCGPGRAAPGAAAARPGRRPDRPGRQRLPRPVPAPGGARGRGAALAAYGLGATGSRLVRGSTDAHAALEAGSPTGSARRRRWSTPPATSPTSARSGPWSGPARCWSPTPTTTPRWSTAAGWPARQTVVAGAPRRRRGRRRRWPARSRAGPPWWSPSRCSPSTATWRRWPSCTRPPGRTGARCCSSTTPTRSACSAPAAPAGWPRPAWPGSPT